MTDKQRVQAYFRYLIERGAFNRHGPFWQTPERLERIRTECAVIESEGFQPYFIILARIMDFCREEGIPYGPGRGSVGGSYVCYLMGIHEVDPFEWDLLFERFMNEERISYPDVDIDISQRHRHRVLEWIYETFNRDGNTVLQVAAFARMGGRAVIDAVAAAMAQTDPNAMAIAETLKKCLPKGNITGGTKQERELDYWLNVQGHGDKKTFRETAENSGWLEHLLKLDSLPSHLAKHAAGVVILAQEDVAKLPQCSPDGEAMVTGFDMYALDKLGYLKYDILGLRTLDIVCDADRIAGGSGQIPDMLELWKECRDDPRPYRLLQAQDTRGMFQFDTPGFQHTLGEYQPTKFDDLVALTALYRPGALDFIDDQGRNMVEVFIARHHNREPSTAPHPLLHELLAPTHGIMLYQEQLMWTCIILAGFTASQADSLRSAVGKKRMKEMQAIKPQFFKGCEQNNIEPGVVARIWENIEAAARYSWNKSHAVFYAIITWWTAWYKAVHPAAFYCALINSFDKDKQENIAGALTEAREHAEIDPPDINVAQDDFVVHEGRIVFGLYGVKGLGDDGRWQILLERMVRGPFKNYEDFATRTKGDVPINKKLALIRCGAFDKTDDRRFLLATVAKHRSEKTWTVAEHINHNRTLKNPRPVPGVHEVAPPTDKELALGEMDALGFYISTTPMKELGKALSRCPKSNTWGGEITGIKKKKDRRGKEMAWFTLITPSLERQRVLVFASVYEHYDDFIEKGNQVLVRGELDGTQVKANAIFEPTMVDHFAKMKVSKNGGPETTEDVESLNQILDLERAGYKVRLL